MTGRWRPLPAALHPEVAYLVGALRELKDRSGLSLAGLAGRTAYSKSTWERYLNGTKLPPRHAVEALAQLVGEPTDLLLALWERAEERWSGRDAEARPATAPPTPSSTVVQEHAETAPRRRGPSWRRPRPPHRTAAALAGGAVTAVLIALVGSTGIFAGPVPAASTGPGYPVGCTGIRCAGLEPVGMACAVDAGSYAELQVGGRHLELRVSDRCAAAWARISYPVAGDRVMVVDRAGRAEATVADGSSTEGYLSTRMVAADRHSQVRACVQSDGGEPRCTPWGGTRTVSVSPPAHPPSRR
nr:helix-turn-helix domain-containing protein [Planosporangium thailandense]